MFSAIASFSAKIATRQYLLGRKFGSYQTVGMNANPIAYGGRHGHGVARFTVTLVVHLSDWRALEPFSPGIEIPRQT